MAVTRRGYIFAAFLLSVLSVLLLVSSIASDTWVVSTARAPTPTPVPVPDSYVQYGLFSGELELYFVETPTINRLYMVCLADINACAVSCKTTSQAREEEVRALANGSRPNPPCVAVTTVDPGSVLDPPPVISFAFYVCLLLIIFLQLAFGVASAGLAIINATRNPTEELLGLPGCLWANVVAAVLGLTVLLMFGIYWATSGLSEHLSLSYIALGQFVPSPGLGYSYWVLVVAVLCSLTNVGLIELRKYLLERDPPPSVIKVEEHSDGTIFLY